MMQKRFDGIALTEEGFCAIPNFRRLDPSVPQKELMEKSLVEILILNQRGELVKRLSWEGPERKIKSLQYLYEF